MTIPLLLVAGLASSFYVLLQAEKCIRQIVAALDSGTLSQGEASKLAGRLSWSTQFLFHRLGRALLRPLFDRAHSSVTLVDSDLRASLVWWKDILCQRVAESYPWARSYRPPVILLVDARGQPAHCAAVALIDGEIHFTDGPPAGDIMASLKERKDNQIGQLFCSPRFPLSLVRPLCRPFAGALETLAIALGLSTFLPRLVGRNVILYGDNKGAEAAARKGSAKQFDWCKIIHGIWSLAFHGRFGLWISRVPTDDNIADLPSREEYDLLFKLGAQWWEPQIAVCSLD